MRDLFDVAEAHRDLPLDAVDELFDHPACEPRLTACCILDFKARGRFADEQRNELCRLYLARHDRITTWGMVDRAAPRVVGGYLAGRDLATLHELAEAPEPMTAHRHHRTAVLRRARQRRRLAGAFDIAGRLAEDPEPVVHNAVGIFLEHAGRRDSSAVRQFLDQHAAAMPRHGLRLAIENLAPDQRARYLSRR